MSVKVTAFVCMTRHKIITADGQIIIPPTLSDIGGSTLRTTIEERIKFLSTDVLIESMSNIDDNIFDDPRSDRIINQLIHTASCQFIEWLIENNYKDFYPSHCVTVDSDDHGGPNLSICYYFDRTMYGHVFEENLPLIMGPNNVIMDSLRPMYHSYCLDHDLLCVCMEGGRIDDN